ncbi:unnamed protein product, partial [Brenthis ino]
MPPAELEPATARSKWDTMTTSTPNLTIKSVTSSCSSSSNNLNAGCAESLHSLIDNLEKAEGSPDEQCSMSCSKDKKKRSICCSRSGQTVWGIIFVLCSIVGFIFPPLDFMLLEKLNMRPGLPPYDWWADPPDEVRMRAHIFNVTNHERFLAGLDDKIHVEEIGPIVYLEKLKHYDIKFNENSTMTYTAKRYLIYLPDENNIDFNDTIIVPNLALLGMLSYLHNANYFVRTGFKIMVNSHDSQLFVRRTIYEYLWDNRESILETSRNLAPTLVPDSNMGMLNKIYSDFTDKYTVRIGAQWGHKNFFKMDAMRGRSYITGYDPNKCPDRLNGATEGVMYHQHISKNDILLCLRKTVCKVMPMYYERESIINGVKVYRFALPENAFDRKRNGTDCYASNAKPLPDGVSDTSKCFFDFPMVASYPHFYTGSPPKDKYVTGLKPDRSKHSSYIYVEPITGVPFKAIARLQCNLQINDLSSFYTPHYNKFSNLILPIGWIEYSQEDLPAVVKHTVYFMVVILPPLSIIMFILLLLLGLYLTIKQFISQKLKKKILLLIMRSKKHKIDNLGQNNLFIDEMEIFLNKCADS